MKSLLVLSGCVALLVRVGFAEESKIYVEAENPVSLYLPFKIMGSHTTANPNGYLEVPWDQNKCAGGGKATYQFNVKTPGTYSVWARTFWMSGCGNSINISVKEGMEKILGEDQTYDTWHWVGGKARVALKAGVNTLTLRNRETGVRIDKFLFTQEREWTPTRSHDVRDSLTASRHLRGYRRHRCLRRDSKPSPCQSQNSCFALAPYFWASRSARLRPR